MANTWSFRDSAAFRGADKNSYSVNLAIGPAFGAVPAGRLVVAALGWGYPADPVALSSATIGGVSAQIVGQIQNGTGYRGAAIIRAVVPSGISIPIVANFGGVCTRCKVAAFSGVPQNAVPLSVVTGQQPYTFDGSIVLTPISTEGEGIIVVAFASGHTESDVTFSYNGVEALVDAVEKPGGAGRYGAAYVLTTTVFASRNITATVKGGVALVAASWG